jgi:hypothetical protein
VGAKLGEQPVSSPGETQTAYRHPQSRKHAFLLNVMKLIVMSDVDFSSLPAQTDGFQIRPF